MSPVLQTITITFVSLAFVLSMVATLGALFLMRRVDALEAATSGSAPAEEKPGSDPEADFEEPWPPTAHKPVPVDPSNPPTIKTYSGPPGSKQCTCHGRPLRPGQQVIWWPRPDLYPGAVELYCADLKGMKRA